MTPDQFLSHLQSKPAAPVYLFLGPEPYHRDECRRALLTRFLGDDPSEDAFIRHDLEQTSLPAIFDDARSFSLFAPRRVIWVSRAEAALPRGSSDSPHEAELAAYLANPSPDVALVFDSARYEPDGDDKSKYERVAKFYAAIRAVVQFPRYSDIEARSLAKSLARRLNLQIGTEEIGLLVESTGASAMSIATEMEKLALYAGPSRRITVDDIAQMVPQARATTIFALVNALASKNRNQALDQLDTLVREGEYLPLALQFLATQFRQALAASEANLRTASQIQGYFSRMGVRMWPSRAAQIADTVSAFPPKALRLALQRIHRADVDLRDTRPDDRIVLEEFVLELTR
jgi:DNA polymerase-3 subunit delta